MIGLMKFHVHFPFFDFESTSLSPSGPYQAVLGSGAPISRTRHTKTFSYSRNSWITFCLDRPCAFSYKFLTSVQRSAYQALVRIYGISPSSLLKNYWHTSCGSHSRLKLSCPCSSTPCQALINSLSSNQRRHMYITGSQSPSLSGNSRRLSSAREKQSTARKTEHRPLYFTLQTPLSLTSM